VIACDFEFLTHQIKFYLKLRRPLLQPQQRRATYPQMAQHMLIRVWVKPGARLMELQKNREGTEKKKKGNLKGHAAIHQINGFIPPHP
jgi:hypothetical protein